MPYKSDKQRGWMHVHLPGIAKKWDKEMSFSDKVEKQMKRLALKVGSVLNELQTKAKMLSLKVDSASAYEFTVSAPYPMQLKLFAQDAKKIKGVSKVQEQPGKVICILQDNLEA